MILMKSSLFTALFGSVPYRRAALRPVLGLFFVWLSHNVLAQVATPTGATTASKLSNSMILRGETQPALLQRLHVKRKISLADLRTNSRIQIGNTKLDFKPVLDNPKALFNIAQRLRTMPQHVQVNTDETEVNEVAQGLVIHHVLAYRILPGKCADATARAQIELSGVNCFKQSPLSARIAEFGAIGNPRYIADPARRQAVVAADACCF